MKTAKPSNALLYAMLIGLVVLALHGMFSQPSVLAQSDVKYGYLQSEEGDATASGGKRFIDMRNGNSWICDWKRCILEGRFPLEQAETKGH
jgi:hypothetical protein